MFTAIRIPSNLSFVVGQIAQASQDPHARHELEIKRVLRFLGGTKSMNYTTVKMEIVSNYFYMNTRTVIGTDAQRLGRASIVEYSCCVVQQNRGKQETISGGHVIMWGLEHCTQLICYKSSMVWTLVGRVGRKARNRYYTFLWTILMPLRWQEAWSSMQGQSTFNCTITTFDRQCWRRKWMCS